MMKSTSSAFARIKPSGIRRINTLAAQQPDCIPLALGEPDFDTPPAISAEVAAALARGETHYPPNCGTPELRRAIAAYMARQGIPADPEAVTVTAGATEAISATLAALLDPGDEVIIPVPAFTLYEAAVHINRGTPVLMSTVEAGFQIDEGELRALVTPATKAIIICTPNNPTGCLLDAASLDAVAAVAEEAGIFVICDDVYNRLVYEGPYERFAVRHPELADRTVVVDSFSKPWAMTGWRLGWVSAAAPIAAEIAKAHQYMVSSVPAFVMPAAARALEVDPTPMLDIYRARRARVLEALDKMGMPPAVKPAGAFYAFIPVTQTGLGSEEFCERAIVEAGVGLVPGECFGCAGFARLSYCVADDALDEGLRRLERFVASLRG
ncbi:pyridoxal phosphate-dependent aminotransferase [Collinsella ihumii]|uniref:pyridoxal phosphate-dependent aminotransferase n=1 Tax=Collinsella ihumii TaxID=1720204 RepID=UPI0025AAEDB1|nr:aminotransferase class I/II-fold pyridoxal phosphate-dependent enzyme [Collinsella ihumii]MDN0054521.1 aminotransferase class I/II-fold pyridoxal phosphate-dependent enzyme [Collinsella ihumii]